MLVLLFFGAGLLPAITGHLMNVYMMANPDKVLPYGLIGVLFLLVWGMFGFISARRQLAIKPALLAAHDIALLALVLVLLQAIGFGRYWNNVVGVASQLYFLPVLNLSSRLAFWGGPLWQVYIVSFLLLAGTFALGYRLGNSR